MPACNRKIRFSLLSYILYIYLIILLPTKSALAQSYSEMENLGGEAVGSKVYVSAVQRTSFSNSIVVEDPVSINGMILPNHDDLNENVDIYVVVRFQGVYYLKNSQGSFESWNGAVDNLIPSIKNFKLEETTRFSIFEGFLPQAGDLEIFVGYSRSGANQLVYNLVPFVFIIKNEQDNVSADDASANSVCESFVQGAAIDEFKYCWKESQATPQGFEYAAQIIEPIKVEIVGNEIALPQTSFAELLYMDFGVVLSNEGMEWTNERAYALREIMRNIPQDIQSPYDNGDREVTSVWQLVDEYLPDDVSVTVNSSGVKSIKVHIDAFENAFPRIVEVEGKRGRYFSNRLHRVAVRVITDYGRDIKAVRKILNEKFAVDIEVADYLALTGEPAYRFQVFEPRELVEIINILEEMPRGMHKVPGMNKLVRRLNGTCHPSEGCDVPAIAWTGSGYVEFLEPAFKIYSLEYIHRLILHEKAHFLWDKLFDDQIKSDWVEVGEWYECDDRVEGWCTRQQTQFVSAYAHLKNPNEDMAESISYFVVEPDALRARAPLKYEFVRDRVMQGNIYLSKIREDLTFEVFNLYPDYVYPGKIKSVEITVKGEAESGKEIIIDLEIHAVDGQLEGVSWARTRLFSEVGTFYDLYFYPVDGSSLGTKLRGRMTLSKFAKSGYWRPTQIVLRDQVGNERMSAENDFGWSLFVNNPLEDLEAPEYVRNSARISTQVIDIQGQKVDLVTVSWKFVERNMPENNGCYAAMNSEHEDTYSREAYGDYKGDVCYVDFLFPNYMADGVYKLANIVMVDKARNESRYPFPQLGEQTPTTNVQSSNPDYRAPELDLNRLTVSANPVNPARPNGETIVNFSFYAKDDISGLQIGNFKIRDPQGNTNFHWYYPPRRSQLWPIPEELHWQLHEATVILPAGSPPGIWGISELTLIDRAGNFKTYSFTEIITIEVID